MLVDQSNAKDQMQNKCKHMINVGRRRISAPRDEMRSCMTPNTADQLQTGMLIASGTVESTANWSLEEKDVGLRSGGMIPLGLHNGPRVQAIGIFDLILELRCCCARYICKCRDANAYSRVEAGITKPIDIRPSFSAYSSPLLTIDPYV